MRGRRILGLGLATAAVALAAASTAYACVVLKGDAKLTGAVQNSNPNGNTVMTGLGSGHGYCTGRSPVYAAAGGVGTSVTFDYAPGTACNTDGSNKLSAGDYDVRLRNTTAGYTGADGTGWTQTLNSGCFVTANAGPKNMDLGNLTVSSTGSGSGTWSIPSLDDNGDPLTQNSATDASVFCVGKFGAGTPPAAPTGSSDGFLAPFRVTTV